MLNLQSLNTHRLILNLEKRESKQIKTDKKNTSKKLNQNKKEKQERSQKTVSRSAYNKQILRQRIRLTYSRPVSNKLKNILILSESILKTLRMREFNNHLEEGIADFKAIPGSKSQQLNHHSIPILQDHKYDGAIIHVGINDLTKNSK